MSSTQQACTPLAAARERARKETPEQQAGAEQPAVARGGSGLHKLAPTQVELLKELMSYTCRCGEGKDDMRTFCRRCYAKLPPANQRALYKRLGAGYEAAYETAATFLDYANRVDKEKNDAKIASLRR